MTVNLTSAQKSALLEAGNIGSGHAAISLSQIMGRRIMIAMPSIEICSTDSIGVSVLGDHRQIVQVAMGVKGDASGAMMFVIDSKMCLNLCDFVMGKPLGSTKEMGDFEKSAVTEVGNILSGSYLNAISGLTRLTLLFSAPQLYVGTTEIFTNFLKSKSPDIGFITDVICIKTEFIQMDVKIEGYLLFLPSKESVGRILTAMSV